MLAPVRVKNGYSPPDENGPASPAREITSRHKVDRRSLLAQCRINQECHQPHQETSKPVIALRLNRGCACQRAAVLDDDGAPGGHSVPGALTPGLPARPRLPESTGHADSDCLASICCRGLCGLARRDFVSLPT